MIISKRMKIGLLRHFKVINQASKVCNSEEYNQACLQYDSSEIVEEIPDLPIGDYAICFSSNKKRAVNTARIVFHKEIIITSELIEVPVRALFKTRLRIPFVLWNIINRIGWLLNCKKLPETRRQTRERASHFLSKLCQSNHQNVLIVTHGFFMLTLREELLKMGFKGERIVRARNGQLYEFEN